MGNSQAKPVEFKAGIEVTPRLLEQLEGKPRVSTTRLRQHAEPLQQISPALEEEVVKLLRRDQELRGALEKSRLAGDLLLKNESEELSQVNNFADQLLAREYRAPSREPPCAVQHEAALKCYQSNAKDPLACASAVDAYAECAASARRNFAAGLAAR